MVKMLDTTGCLVYVHESRVDEYKEAGYILASDSVEETEKPKKRRKKEA